MGLVGYRRPRMVRSTYLEVLTVWWCLRAWLEARESEWRKGGSRQRQSVQVAAYIVLRMVVGGVFFGVFI